MARTRRNPPMVVKLGIGAAALGALGFLAYKLLYKPRPVINAQGVVTKAGWLTAIKFPADGRTTITPQEAKALETKVFYPVGAKVQ